MEGTLASVKMESWSKHSGKWSERKVIQADMWWCAWQNVSFFEIDIKTSVKVASVTFFGQRSVWLNVVDMNASNVISNLCQGSSLICSKPININNRNWYKRKLGLFDAKCINSVFWAEHQSNHYSWISRFRYYSVPPPQKYTSTECTVKALSSFSDVH